MKKDNKKLEDLIFKTYYGKGLYDIYKPNKKNLLSFSRKKIAEYFLSKIKKKIFNKKNNKLGEYKKKIPKVVHIITGLERGGAERFLYNLISNNFNKKIKSSVISLMSEGYYGHLLRKKKIKVFNLNMRRGDINFSAIRKLRKILIKQRPDIIQGWMYHGNLASLVGSFIIKKSPKLSWNIRQGLEIFPEMKLSTRIAIKLGSLFSRIPDLIIYNSIRSLKQHRNIGYSINKDFFIPNGFDTKKWQPNSKTKLKLRKSLGISHDSKIIGYVGRGDDQKDLPTLFKAFDIVSKT